MAGDPRSELMGVWPEVVAAVLEDVAPLDLPPYVQGWLRKLLEYNVPGGKMNRALAVVDTLRILKECRGDKLTPEDKKKAQMMGWCIEIMQAFFLIADDLMDDSPVRRGKPSWQALPGVDVIASNDAFILESILYRLVARYFKKEVWYARMCDLVHETVYRTALGQLLDLTSLNEGPRLPTNDLSHFSLAAYMRIVKYKTVCYSFYLPIAMAFIMDGIEDEKVFAEAFEICVVMGSYFQIQDDFLDCFGSPELIGKVGTDIQEKKLTWLCATVLTLMSAEDSKVFEEHYGKTGKTEEESVRLIKDLYRKYDVEAKFREYETESFAKLQEMMGRVTSVPKEVYESFLSKIYKRKM